MAYPLVPVPGTGDNGYRPNFTTPSPDEARQARLRGAPPKPRADPGLRIEPRRALDRTAVQPGPF